MNSRIAVFVNNAWPLAGVALLMVVGALVPALSHVLDLALPFFGLIALGFFAGGNSTCPKQGCNGSIFSLSMSPCPRCSSA